MLKIVRSASFDRPVYTLSGRLDVEHAVDLQKRFEAENARIVLDLIEVKRVDRDAIQFLSRWERTGIELANCPLYVREWIAKTKTKEDPR